MRLGSSITALFGACGAAAARPFLHGVNDTSRCLRPPALFVEWGWVEQHIGILSPRALYLEYRQASMTKEPPGHQPSDFDALTLAMCNSLTVQQQRPSSLMPGLLEPWVGRFSGLVQVNVGNSCNQQCPHCSLDRDGLFRTTLEEAKGTLEAASELGLSGATFVGGEPTIWPHLFASLTFMRKRRMERAVLNTNGLMLAYPRYLPRLEESGVGTVVCSLDHFEPHGQRLLANREDTPELITAAVDNLAVSPINTSFYTVCTKLLDGKLDKLGEFLLHTSDAFRNQPAVILAPLRHPNLDQSQFDSLAWRFSDLLREIQSPLEAMSRELPVFLKGFPLCLLGPLRAHAFEEHVSILAVDSQHGHPLPRRQQGEALERCALCPDVDTCPGIPPAYVRRFGPDELR